MRSRRYTFFCVSHPGLRARDLDARQQIGRVVEMRRVEGLAAVVRGDQVAASRSNDDRQHEGGVVRIGEDVVHRLAGDGAGRGRPGAGHVRRAGDVHRVGEHGPVRSHLIEADVFRRQRGVRSRDHPRFAAVTPGRSVVFGDEHSEVGAHEDAVRSVRWKVDAELIRKRAIRARRIRGSEHQRCARQHVETGGSEPG